MTLINLLLSSETQDKLRRQERFVGNLVHGKEYGINEIKCCLEYVGRKRSASKIIVAYSDEDGKLYSFLKLRNDKRGLMKYVEVIPLALPGSSAFTNGFVDAFREAAKDAVETARDADVPVAGIDKD